MPPAHQNGFDIGTPLQGMPLQGTPTQTTALTGKVVTQIDPSRPVVRAKGPITNANRACPTLSCSEEDPPSAFEAVTETEKPLAGESPVNVQDVFDVT